MNKFNKRYTSLTVISVAVCAALTQIAWAATSPTTFSNIGSISNTVHNLTQSTSSPPVAIMMEASRNNYGEVCVYCHTPHGAQGGNGNAVKMPLWNRTLKATSFQTYNQLGTTSFSVDAAALMPPGPASLTCLSCHDGQTAIDSIINMPGSFRKQGGAGAQANQYNLGGITSATPGAAQQVKYKLSATFLDTWNNPALPGQFPKDTVNHAGMNSNMTAAAGKALGPVQVPDGFGGFITYDIGCMSCHSPNGITQPGAGTFELANIGTDLRNDHPIGVAYPALTSPVEDWNQTTNAQGTSRYFERAANGRMDKDEIRTYDGKVECASCHDPHGVPTAGPGTVFTKTFLRVPGGNNGSAVCLTCHNK